MSTKSSLGYKEYVITKSVHIYKDFNTDLYYIEHDDSRLELPEGIAKKFAEILDKED